MEPKMEQPKQYTPEEIAQLERSRTISDAGLLKDGAEYSVNKKREKENLLTTESMQGNIQRSHEFEEEQKIRAEKLEKLSRLVSNFFESSGVKKLNTIHVTEKDGKMRQSGYLFHSVTGDRLNVIDSGSAYGGTVEFMEKMEKRGKDAIKNDVPTDYFSLGRIKKIEVIGSPTKRIDLPDIGTL